MNYKQIKTYGKATITQMLRRKKTGYIMIDVEDSRAKELSEVRL